MTIPGIKPLRKIQLGKEATPGTSIAATALWRGIGTIQNLIEPTFVEEDIGLLVAAERSYIPMVGAEIEFAEIEATFEQLPYILSAGILNVVTGTADGVGTDKIYTYNPPLATAGDIKTYTIEGGDNQQEEEMEYSFVKEFKLTGKAKEAVKMGATWQGRQVTKSTFTGSIAIPTVEEILFSKGKLYIDAGGGTIGTTLKSNTFLDMALKWKTGWLPVFAGDGQLYYSLIKPTLPEIELEITFEHDASAVTEKDAWVALTTRLIQMKFEGSAVATGGTLYQKKTLIVNLAGRWKSFDKLDEQDGNDIVKGTLVAGYNATYANIGNIIAVNELATLP